MKRLLLALGLLLTVTVTFAQDVIVKKNNETILCRVVQTTDTHVIYKNWSDLNGQSLAIERSQISAINYQNGKKETVAPITENQYAPNIQNNGMGQYNDRVLLNMDLQNKYGSPEKKAKTWKTVGWISIGIGIVCAAALISNEFDIDDGDILPYAEIGVGSIALIGGVYSLIKGYKYQKIANGYVHTAPLYYQQFNMGNDNSLLTGVDIIKDDFTQQHTLGLGIKLKF